MNLAEQSGREGVVTQGYREYVVELNDKDVEYCEYDFHKETKGMKYVVTVRSSITRRLTQMV